MARELVEGGRGLSASIAMRPREQAADGAEYAEPNLLLRRRRVCNVFLTTALRPLRSFPLQHENKPRGIPRVVGARHSTCDEETY